MEKSLFDPGRPQQRRRHEDYQNESRQLTTEELQLRASVDAAVRAGQAARGTEELLGILTRDGDTEDDPVRELVMLVRYQTEQLYELRLQQTAMAAFLERLHPDAAVSVDQLVEMLRSQAEQASPPPG